MALSAYGVVSAIAVPLQSLSRYVPTLLSVSPKRKPTPYVKRCSPTLMNGLGSRRHASMAQTKTQTLEEQDLPSHELSRDYLDEMYAAWKTNPEQVDISWQRYFSDATKKPLPFSQVPELGNHLSNSSRPIDRAISTPFQIDGNFIAKVQQLVIDIRTRGHLSAAINPLKLFSESISPQHPMRLMLDGELNLARYGLSKSDLQVEVPTASLTMLENLCEGRSSMTLGEITTVLRSIYCGSYGIEFEHITDREKRQWLQNRVEKTKSRKFSKNEKAQVLRSLVEANTFERFISQKYPTEKRYGLDGAESLAPAVLSVVNYSADEHGIEEVVVGSCHRGKLTMLACVYGKPYEAVMAEFKGAAAAMPTKAMSGDVRYHLGHEGEHLTPKGKRVALSLLANPSHLETVGPVAAGRIYATQSPNDSAGKKRSMCLSVHGDAALAGQGIVYESLGFSRILDYDVGGTIRLTVNNQIGFTTDPASSRSTTYCTDIAKFVDAPIFHVNSEDVETLVWICRLAADWRAEFHTDIVIDIVCYRKFGHNEMDQPSLTQPLLYEEITNKKNVLDIYAKKLVNEGSFTDREIEKVREEAWAKLEKHFKSSKSYVPTAQTFPSSWQSFITPEEMTTTTALPPVTSVSKHALNYVATAITRTPDSFQCHRSVQRVLEGRQKAFDEGMVDWSMAEALAFGSLCAEGHPVRITGQDVQRGTFSQRHAIIHDQITGNKWAPLNNISTTQGRFAAVNSPLCEYGALGFEYGITLADPNSLVMWEAQFGDFANNSQVMIDNFIASGETKWMYRSGLVVSLPHGHDGQGPEHSSARLERFLMLCNEEGRKWPVDLARQDQDCNVRVAYPTTAANYFHLLRRQIYTPYRKPVVLLFSKSLLRHEVTRSSVDSLTNGSVFQPVLRDLKYDRSNSDLHSVTRMILCTGQVHAALYRHRESSGINNVAITRIEELHPFPFDVLLKELDRYPNLRDIKWVQEEHYNGGAWHHVRDRLETVLKKSDLHKGKQVSCVSRSPSASPAAGLKKDHERELQRLLEDSFSFDH